MPKIYYKSLCVLPALLSLLAMAGSPAFAQNQDPFGGSEVRWPDQPPGAYLNDGGGSEVPQYDNSQGQNQIQGQSQIQWLGQPTQQAAARPAAKPIAKPAAKPVAKTAAKPAARPQASQGKPTASVPTFGDMLKQQQAGAGNTSSNSIPGFTPVSQQAMQAFQQPMQQMQQQMQPQMQSMQPQMQSMQPQMQQQMQPMQMQQMQPQMQMQQQMQMQPVQGQVQMSQNQGGAEQIPGFSPVGGGTPGAAGASGSDIPGFTPSTGMAEVLKNIMPAPGTTIKLPATSPYVTQQQQQRRPVARNNNSIGSNVGRTVNNTVNRSINQMLYRGLNSLRF